MPTERPPGGADPLEGLFADLRAAPPAVSDDLMARVLADAQALQPQRPMRAPARAGIWARVWGLLGSGGMAGLATAGVAGLLIGFLQPVDLALAAAPLELLGLEEVTDPYPADWETLASVLDVELLSKE